jgi:DNA-binding Xre family transcriptional regulator
MVKTRIGELARAAGIEKPYHFQQQIGLSPTTAYRLFNDEGAGLENETIDRLCEFFGCEPGELFVRTVTLSPKQPSRPGRQRPPSRRGSKQKKSST